MNYKEQKEFLIKYYPTYGMEFCMKALNCNRRQILRKTLS